MTKDETHCHLMGYCFQLAARDIVHTPSHRQDITECYTSCGAQSGTGKRSVDPSGGNDPTTLYHERTLDAGILSVLKHNVVMTCVYVYLSQTCLFQFRGSGEAVSVGTLLYLPDT